MFDTKERAAMAANIVGTLAAGSGWDTSVKRLAQQAEEILVEIELMYRPRVEAEEKKVFEDIRQTEFFESFRYLMLKH